MKKLLFLLLLVTYSFIAHAQIKLNTTSSVQRQQELSIIKSAWVSLHPGLYRFNTPAKIDQYFETAKQKVSKPLSEENYFILLSQLATKIKCGHTFLNPWNQKEETIANYFSSSYIPFLYKVIDGKFIITHNLSENSTIRKGDEIISINGIKATTVIDSLLTVSRADGNNGSGKKMDNINIVPLDIDTANYSMFDIYFPLFFPKNFNTAKYTFIIKPYKGSPETIVTKSLSKKERQEVYVARFGAIPLHEKNWEFKFLQTSTAYLRIGDFETWEWKADYKQYLDSVFLLIKNAKTTNLVIDIRGNEGGDDEARDYLLSYIINKPFGCDDPKHRLYKFLSIPDTLLPYLKTWDKEFKKPKNENEYNKVTGGYYEKIDTSKSACTPTYPKPNVFKGNAYLITNANNSSTTFTLADIFQINHSGKIIGEQTGGTKKGINGGQFFFLNLPYSKFEIDLPIIWGAPTLNRPDEGVKPDYEVKTNQKDIYSGIDTQLNFILSLISK